MAEWEKVAQKYFWNYVFYSKSISTIVNSTYITKVLHLLNYLCYYAALVCISCILSHLFLGNIISSLVTEIHSYYKLRKWLYCKVFNKEYSIVILFSKCRQNFNQKLFDNETPTLTKRESNFSVDSVISAESTRPLFCGT